MEKSEILVKTALSYFERGVNLQYDQRCMDRTLFLTPRRRKLLPPEASTSQNTQYLDCSSFVGAIYYEAFGYELPHDLTWHMVDYVEPRLYYHEFNHQEDDYEIIKTQMKEILQAGDVIVYDRGVGSGHTLMYIGNDKYVHCTTNGRPDSYDYVNCKSREYEDGGLFVDDIENMLSQNRIFAPKVRRVSIARPVLNVGEPTKRTVARMKYCDGLYIEVLTNPAGYQTVNHGEEIEFCLKVIEKKGNRRTAALKIEVPVFAKVIGDSDKQIEISPNDTTTALFKVVVEDKNISVLDNVKIYLDEFDVFVPVVLLGNNLTKTQTEAVETAFEKDENFSFEKVSNIYKDMGFEIENSEAKVLQKLFYLHDSPTGDVLSRKPQIPSLDGAVYSLFGGTGVVTPQMIYEPFIRTNRVVKRDFCIGDVIVISNDACANQSFFAVYLGGKIVGKTEYDSEFRVLQGEQIDEFIDSLLGRFCFAVLRPSLKVKE